MSLLTDPPAASPVPPGLPAPHVAPYLGATALASVAMMALVVVGLPAAPVLQVGLTFLAVALVARRLDDLDWAGAHPLLAWAADRLDALGDKFGVEFYGLAALTFFLGAEVASLLDTSLSLADLLADPVVTALTWVLTEMLESLTNALWALLWWMGLLDAVGSLEVFAPTVVAGWLVWRVLEITPRAGDPLGAGFGEEMEELGHGLREDLHGLGLGMDMDALEYDHHDGGASSDRSG